MSRIQDLFKTELVVASVGSQVFLESLHLQGTRALQVDWDIPCHGDERLFSILERLTTEEVESEGRCRRLKDIIEDANCRAFQIINRSHPFIVGVGRAIDYIPGMADNLILHAGPPVRWENMCGPMRGAVMGALIY